MIIWTVITPKYALEFRAASAAEAMSNVDDAICAIPGRLAEQTVYLQEVA